MVVGQAIACSMLMDGQEKYIQGTWHVYGENNGHGWFLEWTFDNGKFKQTGYPPIIQEGKCKVVSRSENKLTIELYDQKGTFGNENRKIEIVIDKDKGELIISGTIGFKRKMKKKEKIKDIVFLSFQKFGSPPSGGKTSAGFPGLCQAGQQTFENLIYSVLTPMKIIVLTIFVFGLMSVTMAQDLKNLVVDGTKDVPEKYALQPKIADLLPNEIEEVKKEALRTEVEFSVLPQASAEETLFLQDFELLDVAEGFFIYREIEFKAFLYTAWSNKLKRNYQGIMVISRSKKYSGETQSKVLAHYVYRYRGDKYLRLVGDINQNILSEIAFYSEPPTKTIQRRFVRIIEFSPNGIEKLGSMETYSRRNRPNYLPRDPKQKKIAQPPEIFAAKLYVQSSLGKKPVFFAEKMERLINGWSRSEEMKQIELQPDTSDYIEIIKPVFPKGPGEK